MTLVYPKDSEKRQKTVLMTISNSDKSSSYMGWNYQKISLLKRGWILSFVHARGSLDFGPQWEEDGILLKKKNSFDDLRNCVNWLIEQNYTKLGSLCAMADGEGSTAFAVLANENPNLFKAMILKNGLFDIISTLNYTELPLNQSEIKLWGNPNDKKDFQYIKSYDPYWNIKPQKYPAMLVTYSLMDMRAPFWNQLRYVTKLRFQKVGDRDLILKMSNNFNPEESPSNSEKIKEASRFLSFLFINMAIVAEKL